MPATQLMTHTQSFTVQSNVQVMAYYATTLSCCTPNVCVCSCMTELKIYPHNTPNGVQRAVNPLRTITAPRQPTMPICYLFIYLLHCVLTLAAQCIVTGPICWHVCNGQVDGRVGGMCLWVCYHDTSKLRGSIFTKLGL